MSAKRKSETPFEKWWVKMFGKTLGVDSILKIGYRAAFNAGRRAERRAMRQRAQRIADLFKPENVYLSYEQSVAEAERRGKKR